MTPTTTMTPSQALTQWTDQVGGAMRDWWDTSTQAWEPLWQAWAQPMGSLTSAMGGPASWGATSPQALSHEHHTRHAHGHQYGHDHRHQHGPDHGHHHAWGRTGCDCGCGDAQDKAHGRDCRCGCSSSQQSRSCCDPCACCIPDADVVVHTRIGERRVVPFQLCNERHRDREVTLAVGDWVACEGPALAIRAVLEPAGAVTLAPCECRVVRLLVAVAGAPTQANQAAPVSPDPATGKTPPKDLETVPGREPATDVDACATAYADVRFEGCARPVRVAVVVHPAACDALPVDCGCGCCCRDLP